MDYWKFILGLLVIAIPSALTGQVPDLPSDLEDFYSNYNYINFYSIPPERSFLVSLDPNHLDQIPERLQKVYEKMSAIRGVYLNTSGQMPNAITSWSSLKGSECIQVSDWEKQKDKIFVRSNVYFLDEETHYRLIKELDAGNLSQEISFPLMQGLAKITSGRKEIHEWVMRNGKWYKSTLNKILLE